MKTKSMRNILVFLLLFLGLGAIFGGAVLIISPSGKLFGMPLSILNNSPFTNFLIPGIILFIVLGIAPVGLALILIKKPANKFAELFNFYKDMYWGWTYCIYTAFVLIIWIQVETIYIKGTSWLQTFYMFFSIPLIFIALLPQVRNLYKNEI